MSHQACRYLIFHKPYDVLCSFTDPEQRPTLKEFIPVTGVYSAGRLDRDSEGLLLLTDDGEMIHQITDPKAHLPKTYLVQVEGSVTPHALGILMAGVEIQGYKTKRCQAMLVPPPDFPERSKPVTPHDVTCWIRLSLEEGKKRQIRHMTAAVGFPTLRLVRIAIGPIHLGLLKSGEWRYLTDDELTGLRGALQGKRRLQRRSSKRV